MGTRGRIGGFCRSAVRVPVADMSTVTEEMQSDPATAVYECTNCGFVYSPAIGDPDGGIKPGTPFDQIPDDWECPMCGAKKSDFRKMDVGEDFDAAA